MRDLLRKTSPNDLCELRAHVVVRAVLLETGQVSGVQNLNRRQRGPRLRGLSRDRECERTRVVQPRVHIVGVQLR